MDDPRRENDETTDNSAARTLLEGQIMDLVHHYPDAPCRIRLRICLNLRLPSPPCPSATEALRSCPNFQLLTTLPLASIRNIPRRARRLSRPCQG